MKDHDAIKAIIKELKEYYHQQKGNAMSMEKLANRPVDQDIQIDFWELSPKELQSEMWNRLENLDADTDCLPKGPIRSHRKILGPPIIFSKRLFRFVTWPYSKFILEKQNRLNRQLVSFQLLTFLRLENMEKRMNALESIISKWLAGQDETIDSSENKAKKK